MGFLEYVLVRAWADLDTGYDSAPYFLPEEHHCEDLTIRLFLGEDKHIRVEGTYLCPGDEEERLRELGLEVIEHVSEEEAKRLPRFVAVEGKVEIR